MFHSVDPETGASLGCAGAVITITIQQFERITRGDLRLYQRLQYAQTA